MNVLAALLPPSLHENSVQALRRDLSRLVEARKEADAVLLSLDRAIAEKDVALRDAERKVGR